MGPRHQPDRHSVGPVWGLGTHQPEGHSVGPVWGLGTDRPDGHSVGPVWGLGTDQPVKIKQLDPLKLKKLSHQAQQLADFLREGKACKSAGGISTPWPVPAFTMPA